jgi:hypothetical protein
MTNTSASIVTADLLFGDIDFDGLVKNFKSSLALDGVRGLG